MTPKEAINCMKNEKCCILVADKNYCSRECSKCDLVMETDVLLTAYDKAIEALELYDKLKDEMAKRNMTAEHIVGYMKFEDECVEKGFTFKSLIEAREKQIPKKPYKDNENGVYEKDYCPTCNRSLFPNDHHCRCGQAIDWSEEE